MNKIILLDDRPKRMKLAFEKNGHDLNLYTSIEGLYIPIENDCIRIKNELNNGLGESVAKYSLIIAHQSAFSGMGLRTIDSICKVNSIKLILFSGSIRQPVYYSDNGFHKLIVNSKDFYSVGLPLFMKKTVGNELEHITELLYADKWRLSVALRYRQLLIDEKYGDDLKTINHKHKQLLNCISILGECTLEKLTELINEEIQI
jgi:hypothetical protein